jgi:flagellar hook capping protein FlgD
MPRLESHDGGWRGETALRAAADQPQSSPVHRNGATPPVSVEVFDVAGRAVRTLAARRDFATGTHSLAWDGADRFGVPLKRGVYLIRLSAEGGSLTRKFVVLQ